jgi:hypothetical protein
VLPSGQVRTANQYRWGNDGCTATRNCRPPSRGTRGRTWHTRSGSWATSRSRPGIAARSGRHHPGRQSQHEHERVFKELHLARCQRPPERRTLMRSATTLPWVECRSPVVRGAVACLFVISLAAWVKSCSSRRIADDDFNDRGGRPMVGDLTWNRRVRRRWSCVPSIRGGLPHFRSLTSRRLTVQAGPQSPR